MVGFLHGEQMEQLEYAYNMIVGQLSMLFPFILLGTGAYFTRRWVRAVERRSEAAAELVECRARIAELEDSQESLQRDVMRLQAGHEFTTQILGARVASSSGTESQSPAT